MLSANASTITALRSDNRVFTYSVIVNGTTDITNAVLSAQITETGASTQKLGIGEFCRSQCTLTVTEDALSDWYHAYFTVSATINGTTIPLGKYYVPEVDIRSNPGTVTVTGYDTSWLWEDVFTLTSMSTAAIVTAIETYTGQSITNKALLSDHTIDISTDSDDAMTYRDMMGFIAGLEGYNIRNNRLGNFELYKYFGSTPAEVVYDEIFENGISYELTPTAISSYDISNGTENFVQGSGYGVTYYNPYMATEMAEDIDDYIGETYTAADVHFRGNPLLQVGDSVTIQNYSGSIDTPPAIVGQAIVGQSRVGVVSIDSITVPIMEQGIVLDGGLSMTVHAYSEFNSIEYETPAQRFIAMRDEVNDVRSELIQTQNEITLRVEEVGESVSELSVEVDSVNASVNSMHTMLDDDGLHIYDEGDTITTITGDGLKVNMFEGLSLDGPIVGDELLSATSEGVDATRLTARETLVVKADLFNLSVKTFYNDIDNMNQIGFYAVALEDNT